MADRRRLTKVIGVRVTDEEYARLWLSANQEQKTVPALMRELALARLETETWEATVPPH